MAKKLLSEAQVRRFAKLANLSPINEMYTMEEDTETPLEETTNTDETTVEEGMYAEEEAEMPEPEMAADEPEMAADEPEMDMPSEETAQINITDEEAEVLERFLQKLTAGLGGDELGDEEEMSAPAPEQDEEGMEAADMMGDEEDLLEDVLEGINYIPENKEIVEEVARRVAKRLLEAKKAQANLNKALGSTKKSR